MTSNKSKIDELPNLSKLSKEEKYKKALEILLDDSILDKDIIQDKKSDKYKTEDSDCIIVDYAKDINELSNEEYKSLKKQDQYRKLDKIKDYAKKGSVLYGVGNTVLGIGTALFLI